MKEILISIISKLNISETLVSKVAELFDSLGSENQKMVLIIIIVLSGMSFGSKKSSADSDEFKSISATTVNDVPCAKITTAPKYYRTVREAYMPIFNELNYKESVWVEWDSKDSKNTGLWAFETVEQRDDFLKKCEENYKKFKAENKNKEETKPQSSLLAKLTAK